MAQMIFTNDFTAQQHFFELPPLHPVSKTFKKGDKVNVSETTDFGLKKHLVAIAKVNGTDISFNVTNAPLIPYVQSQSVNDNAGLGNKYDAKSLLTPKNIFIGVLAIVAIFATLKLTKLI